MTKDSTMAEDSLKNLDIKMWVEQLFATSATDEQLKVRLVKNISAYTTNKIIEELRLLLSINHEDITGDEIRDRIEVLEKALNHRKEQQDD